MKNNPQILLSSAYFGPIQYFARFVLGKSVGIEQCEHYLKQSYRNRCIIMGANNAMALVVPVKKPKGNKTIVKDVLIDYDTDWQKNHLQSIKSAYKNSAFFEHYYTDYFSLIKKKTKYLVDMNAEILEITLQHLDIKAEIQYTEKYFEDFDHIEDYREIIHPKSDIVADPSFKPPDYIQVFSDRHGFMPNLSILDLIFNTGPEAAFLLRNSLV